MEFKTPILFKIWNRPDVTQKVFDRIREVKPTILFVSADGPRKGVKSDSINCKLTRKVIDGVDWKCKVVKLYSSKNLGLKKSVSSAITWFFDKNEYGIILEDDCLPDISFFSFCESMLVKYRNDKRVMMVSGDNFLPEKKWNNKKYYFTRYPHIWGWGSWRRAWKNYDPDMKHWPIYKKSNEFKMHFKNTLERLFWKTIFQAVHDEKIKTWDYQWLFSVLKAKGLSINPGVNLVTNIGFGEGATNTTRKSTLSNIKTGKMSKKITHPTVKVNKKFDDYTAKNIFNINIFQTLARAVYYNLT